MESRKNREGLSLSLYLPVFLPPLLLLLLLFLKGGFLSSLGNDVCGSFLSRPRAVQSVTVHSLFGTLSFFFFVRLRVCVLLYIIKEVPKGKIG